MQSLLRQDDELRCLRHRFLITVILLLLSLTTVSAHAGKETPSGESARQPKLALTSTPAFGFAPMTVQLVATLTGIDPNDSNFCHAAVTWVRVDPGASPEKETRVTEAPRCVHDKDEPSVATTFSKSFDLYQAGSYLYRVSVLGKDGKEIRSNYVTVKVLRVP
jgi:hypothetical protein